MGRTRETSEARQRILETADRLFYQDGLRAVGIDRIIAEANVAKMSLYKHFPSKDDLILAVLQYREESVLEFFRSAMERHGKKAKSPLRAFFAALKEWFETSPGGPFNYGPDGANGTQLFFYQADEAGAYSRSRTGLHHFAFLVESREVVREAHAWARAHDAVILDEPGEFPQYGPHCFATYWLDPHGIKLEAVCHTPEEG